MHKRFFTFIFIFSLVLGVVGCPQNEEETTTTTSIPFNSLSQSEINEIRSGMSCGTTVSGIIDGTECTIELDASQGVFTATSSDNTIYKGEFFYLDNHLYMMITAKKTYSIKIYQNAQVISNDIQDNTQLSFSSIDADAYEEAKNKFRDDHPAQMPSYLATCWKTWRGGNMYGSYFVIKIQEDGYVVYATNDNGYLTDKIDAYARIILCSGNKIVFEYDETKADSRKLGNLNDFKNDYGLYIQEYECSVSSNKSNMTFNKGIYGSYGIKEWEKGGTASTVSVEKELSSEELISYITTTHPQGEYTFKITDASPDYLRIANAIGYWDGYITGITLDLSKCTEMTEIPYDAKYQKINTNNHLKSIIFPNSLIEIGNLVFYDSKELSSIQIPNSIKKIGRAAFSGCNSLKRLDYDGTIEKWMMITLGDSALSGSIGKAFDDYDELYINDELLTELIVPDTITDIKAYAFYGNKSLTKVTLPDGVISIGDNAFSNCSNLTDITISNTVTSIGAAFTNCSSLENIVIPNQVTIISSETFKECSQLKNITLPNVLTNIGKEAFYKCSALSNITIPSSVAYINGEAFAFCGELTEVTFLGENAPTLSTVNYSNQYTYEDHDIFYECPLKNIYVPISSIETYKYKLSDYADIIQAITE